MARLTQLMFGSRYTWLDWVGMKVYSSSVIEPGTVEMAIGIDDRIYMHPDDIETMFVRDGVVDHLVTGQD